MNKPKHTASFSTPLAAALRDNLRRRKTQADHLSLKHLPQKKQLILISGGQQLNGTIPISGAKNAALPMMVASLLTDQTISLTNIPNLTDTLILAQLLEALGANISHDQKNKTLNLTAKNISTSSAPHELVAKMRASFWVLAPLVARTGRAYVPLPGGDAIGARPVEIYLDGLRALGAQVELSNNSVSVKAEKLTGNHFRLPFPSVGATHTLMMAASCAQGETRLENIACEPEISALANMLNRMGAHIETGKNNDNETALYISGNPNLTAAKCRIPSDRIEAGTYAIAAAATGGKILLAGAPVDHMDAIISALQQAGAEIKINKDSLSIARDPNDPLLPVNIATAPYPGFPTDLQAQFMALMTQAQGSSQIAETIFENRFQHAAELQKLGAEIQLHKNKRQTAHILGPTPLRGAAVSATDLRASASLVIAALTAAGQTSIDKIYHLDRGFETIEDKLRQCGARIERKPAEK